MVRFILMFLLLCMIGHAGAQEIKIEKSKEIVAIQGKSYYLHTVVAGQTLFSICKAYGVSVDEVKLLNGKKDNSLSPGEVLQIPYVEPFKRVDGEFYYHRMRPKETLYSVSQKFRIRLKRILKDNPEYDVSRPIAEGAVVKLALKQIDRNVLEAELRWQDRQAQEEAKAQQEEKLAEVVPLVQKKPEGTVEYTVGDSVYFVPNRPYEERHVKVALLLPFGVKENKLPAMPGEIPVDSAGVHLRDERWRLQSRSEPFLQFYQGVLMAVDSLKNRGYTIDLYVFDTERDPSVVQGLMGELNRIAPDLIVGPVYPNTFKIVASQLQNKLTPMIYPLSAKAGEFSHSPNFVQMSISTPALLEEMADWIVANGRQANLINIIPDGGAASGEEGRLTSLVRNRLHGEQTIRDYRWHANIHVDSLRRILKPGVENIILFPTVNEAAASRTLPVLSALPDGKHKVTVIGFPEWLKFTSVDDEVYYKLNTKMFVNSYVDYQGNAAKNFSAKHREYFYSEPNNIANRAYDMILNLVPIVDAQRVNTMNTLKSMDTNGQFTRFRFRPSDGFGGVENRGLYMVNYNSGYVIFVKPVNP